MVPFLECESIERVQKRFLKCVGIKFNFPLESHNNGPTHVHLDLPTLDFRREEADILSFIYNLINGHINNTYL